MKLKWAVVILNDEIKINEYLAKIDELLVKEVYYQAARDKICAQTIMHGHSIVITGSLLKETGKLMNLEGNYRLQEFFKFEENAFSALQNISQLLPPSISLFHHIFVKNFIKKGSVQFLRKNRLNFCKLANNYILPTTLYLTPIFHYKNDFCINAILTKIESNSHFILFKDDGKIDGISESLQSELNFHNSNPNDFLDQLHIFFFIPHLFETISLESAEKQLHPNNHIINLLLNEKLNIYWPRSGNIEEFLQKIHAEDWFQQNKAKTYTSKEQTNNNSEKFKKQLLDQSQIPHFIMLNNQEALTSIQKFLFLQQKQKRLKKYRATIDLILIGYYSHPEMYTRYFIVKINELISEDIMQLNIYDHLYSDSFSRTKSQASSYKLSTMKTVSQSEQEEESQKNQEKLKLCIQSNDFASPQQDKGTDKIEQNKEKMFQPIIEETDQDLNAKTLQFSTQSNHTQQPFLFQMKQKDPYYIPEEGSEFSQQKISIKEEVQVKVIKSKYLEKQCEQKIPKKQAISENSYSRKRANLTEDKLQAKIDNSIASSHSHKTFTSILIQAIIHSEQTPYLLKKIIAVTWIQVLFFITINMTLILIINTQFINFNHNVEQMLHIEYVVQSLSIMMYNQDFEYYQSIGLISELTALTQQNIYTTNEQSKESMNLFLNDYDATNYDDFFSQSSKIKFIYDETVTYQIISIDQLIFTLYSEIYEVTLKENFDFNKFLFLSLNYDFLFEFIENKIINFKADGQSNLDTLLTFYQILAILGLIFAALLQFINLPFLNNAYIYQERLLGLIGRISEKECVSEINKLQNFIGNLNQQNDDYNIFYSDKVNAKQTNYLLEQLNQQNAGSQNKLRILSLFTQIREQKLMRFRMYFSSLFSVLIIIGFFTIVLIYQSSVKTKLNQAITMNDKFSDFHISMNYLYCKQYQLLAEHSPKVQLNKYYEENLIQSIQAKFIEEFNKFVDFELNHLNTFYLTDSLTTDQQNIFNSLFNNNPCSFDFNSHLEICSNNIIETSFKFGLIGSISTEIKYLTEINDLLNSQEIILESKLEKIFDPLEIELKSSIFQLLVFQSILIETTLDRTNQDIISGMFNSLLLIFILVGVFVIVMLMMINGLYDLNLRAQILNLRKLLIIVPIEKWSDQTIFNLLKNIEKL